MKISGIRLNPDFDRAVHRWEALLENSEFLKIGTDIVGAHTLLEEALYETFRKCATLQKLTDAGTVNIFRTVPDSFSWVKHSQGYVLDRVIEAFAISVRDLGAQKPSPLVNDTNGPK